MQPSPNTSDFAALGEEELVTATGESLANVRAWLKGEVPLPVGVRQAIETMRALAAQSGPNSIANPPAPSLHNGIQPYKVGYRGPTDSAVGPVSNIRGEGARSSMLTAQKCLFEEFAVENDEYLKTQLITYIGNKRSLLPFIETGIREARAKLGKERIDFLDLFSGSGVVARMARQYSRVLHCNDLELYSCLFNSCYQANAENVDHDALANELDRVRREVQEKFAPGFIAEL